uniref:Enhancer of polycomb homolog 1 n=1 Tax=Canis lupus dingo TaxID=286419 RepID=A0A8C0LRW3_CANLU
MSKLSFRARALDASKPLPVFRCEDLPDLHEYASINRAVPQMPTGMEKEEESVRVNSPVRPGARPRSLCCLRRRRSSRPSQNGRHLLLAADSGRRPGLPPLAPGLDPRPLRPGGAPSKATRRSRPLVPGSRGVREPERHKGVT